MAARFQVRLSVAECEQIASGVIPGRLRDGSVLFLAMRDHWTEWAVVAIAKLRRSTQDERRYTSQNENWNRKAENWIRSLSKREWELQNYERTNRKPKARPKTWDETINKMEREWRYAADQRKKDEWDKWAENKSSIARKRRMPKQSLASDCGK